MAKNFYRRKFFRPSFKLWVELLSYAGVAFGIFIIAGVIYLEYFSPEALISRTPVPDVSANATEVPAAPEEAFPPSDADRAPPTPGDEAPDEESGELQGVITPGMTAGELLQQWLSPAEAHALVEACKDVYPLARLNVGQPYVAYLDKGALVHFEYEIDRDNVLVVTRQVLLGEEPDKPGQIRWIAEVEPIQYEVRLARVEGVFESSLFESVAKAGERPALAMRLAEIFAWEINFIRDIQPGDSFRVLIEKRYRDGVEKAYGAIPAAEFINKGSKFEAYRYLDSAEKPAYFNAAGDSMRRAFLKAPLSFTRISSRYNLSRMHPILNTVRPHPAVDYAAPSGTPVNAIGSGVVTFRGWGKGAGNYITLRHPNGYESMYLHLSGFAKNLRKGGRVRQGEVIGFVGSTGYSTGPHLDFRMKKNGQFVNPEKVLSPRDESVPKKELEAFKRKRDLLRLFLEGKKDLNEHIPEKD